MYPQRLYEVRYSDGSKVRLFAHLIYRDEATICLKKAPGDEAGNTVFVAPHQAGVTILEVAQINTGA